MKTIHITTGLSDGGAEAVLYRLICQDASEQYHVISLMGEGKYGTLLREAGAKVSCLNMPRGRLTLRGVTRLWRLLRAERPEVVQTWMYHGDLVGGVIAKLAGISRICWGIHHTTLEPGKSARSTIWVAKINAKLSRWIPNAIVCCAEKSRDVHAALGYASKKLVVIPNGYDLKRFSPDKHSRERLRYEMGLGENDCLLGMVGRFDPQKDHANLVSALSYLKKSGASFRCILVGTGMTDSNKFIASLIVKHELQQQVLLLGQRNDVPALMNALDFHILSSTAEAFPNVLAEAMACGTPCVTTHVGDAGIIVGDTGWVVPPSNPVVLAAAVSAAMHERVTQPQAWETRKTAARDRIESKFSIDKMVYAYKQVWEGRV